MVSALEGAMPTYEYVCRACGEHVEVVQSFKEDPLTTCGICGGELRKVFSAAGIIFKGSGYYVTDTRKTEGAQAGKKDDKKKDDKKETTADSSSSSESTSSSTKAESA
jgi:putative FmdB family regulatory protein